MKIHEFIYCPAKIIRVNYVYLTTSVIVGLILCFSLGIHVSTSFANFMLFAPILITISPGIWNLLKMISNYTVINQLQKLVNSEKLVDLDNHIGTYKKNVRASVIIKYEECDKYIDITIWPNGIEHSDNVYELSKRMSEIFGYTAYVYKEKLTCVTYRLNKCRKVSNFSENEF